MTTYTKNLVTDYSAPTDGSSDCETAWLAFKTFLAGCVGGDTVILNIPNSTQGGPSNNTYVFATVVRLNLVRGLLGGLSITINGNNTTFSDGGSGTSYQWGTATLQDSGGVAAFIDSVNAGSTTVRVKTLAKASLFSVGQWMCLAGVDLLTVGQPPHAAFLEYVQVTAINTGTGVVTFTPALTQGYSDTWPAYDASAAQGGAATILVYPPIWDVTATINDLTLNSALVAQMYVIGRSFTFNNVVGVGQTNLVPTSCRDVTFSNCVQIGSTEIDQLLQYLTYSGGSVHRTATQSMGSVNQIFDGVTCDSGGQITGSGRYTTVNNCSTSKIAIGAGGYGRTDRYTVTNSNVAEVATYNVSTSEVDISQVCDMTNGLITVTDAQIATWGSGFRWPVPGTWMFLSCNTGNFIKVFKIIDVFRIGTTSYVQTSFTGGWPDLPAGSSGYWTIRVHNCPQWFASNNLGCADIVDLSQPGAQGKPIYSYSKRSYTGNQIQAPAIQFEMWGKLLQINVNVITPYTGVAALTLACLGNSGTKVLAPDGLSYVFLTPSVNLKIAGTRTYAPSGAIGLQSGDSTFSAPGDVGFIGLGGGPFTPIGSRDISGESSATWPVVEVEMTADQGIYYRAPLRLRLH